VHKLSGMHKRSTQRTLYSLLYGILPHHILYFMEFYHTIYDL